MRATGPAPVDGACGRLRPEAATEKMKEEV